MISNIYLRYFFRIILDNPMPIDITERNAIALLLPQSPLRIHSSFSAQRLWALRWAPGIHPGSDSWQGDLVDGIQNKHNLVWNALEVWYRRSAPTISSTSYPQKSTKSLQILMIWGRLSKGGILLIVPFCHMKTALLCYDYPHKLTIVIPIFFCCCLLFGKKELFATEECLISCNRYKIAVTVSGLAISSYVARKGPK